MALPAPEASRVVVVTGASSGIGAALARELAAAGHRLVLVARRRDRIERLAGELRREHGCDAATRAVDLADADARAGLEEELRGREVAGLCNVAGRGGFGRVSRAPDTHRQIVRLNVEATVSLTGAVLGGMLERRAGAILNVGSLLGFRPMPRSAVYGATKSFVHSYSRALHAECRGTGVSCTAISPGPVRTEFTRAADATVLEQRGPAFAWTTPEAVARRAVAAMRAGRPVVVPGALTKALAGTARVTPNAAHVRAHMALNPFGLPD